MNRMCKAWMTIPAVAVAVAAMGFSVWTSAQAGEAAKPDANSGRAIVTQVCIACHGADGNSASDIYPKLAGQHAEYLAKQLKDFKPQPGAAQPARNNAIMSGMAAALTDRQIADVAAYLSAQAMTPGYAHDKDTLALGQRIYRAGIAERGVPACAGCHGPSGQGIPSQYPRLSGQWAGYVASQLNAFREAAGARRNSDSMRAIAARLSDSEIEAVADYVSGLH